MALELLGMSAVRAGHVLARPVTNAGGAVLCPAGFRLTESVIERLRSAGIESILVEGGQARGPSPQERVEALNRRFEGVDDPLLLQVKATIENRLNLMNLERDSLQ